MIKCISQRGHRENTEKQSLWLSVFPVVKIFCLLVLLSCVEEPTKEDVPELITKATLTFTPQGGGSTVVVSAIDPDGEGVKDIEPDGVIALVKDVSYTLSLSLINELADPTSPDYNITEQVNKEGDEHLFFFDWTNNLFADPAGDGNIDNRSDAISYQDTDGQLPIGLITQWKTTTNAGTGTFRILLKHQPGIKSSTSNASQGETDLDLTFDIQVQ